eukprot:17312_1
MVRRATALVIVLLNILQAIINDSDPRNIDMWHMVIITALHSCSETNGLKNAMTAIDIGRHLRSPQSPLANRGLRAYVDLEGDARTESDSDHAWTLASLNLYFASRDS